MTTLGVADEVDGRAAFGDFVALVEQRLRRALVGAYGADVGREATADALAWAWQPWDRVQGMANPAGYLWRVGWTSARRLRHARRREVSSGPVELDLVSSTRGQRRRTPSRPRRSPISPISRGPRCCSSFSYSYTLAEAGEVLGCSVSTIRNHVARALARLRAALEV